MTDRQILVKAIKKAKKNGWKAAKFALIELDNPPKIIAKNPKEQSTADVVSFMLRSSIFEKFVPTVIFSHDFAKHFWGGRRRLLQ